MRDDFPLNDDARKEVRRIRRADIVVGVPSYNNAGTIAQVVRAINAGLAKYFPDRRAILVNSDGGSRDDTPEVVRRTAIQEYRPLLTAHPLHPIHKIITPYHGLPGKGSALRTVFRIAAELDASACAVLDADLRSVTPEWLDLLLSPLLREGMDFVAPLYHRHKYDGTITNSIVYPLTRALYGQRVRQPIGGDFGFSGRLARHWLDQDVWHTDVARFGIDIWMTTTAITGGFQTCQSFLGAKIHDAKDPSVDLSAMLMQVVGAVFQLMETEQSRWKAVRGSETVPVYGFEFTVGLEPVAVNVGRMLERFRAGLAELESIWARILDPATLAGIRELAAAPDGGFRYSPELWVRTIYDFAVAHHRRVIHRDHLLKSLTPLYLGRTASFVLETETAGAGEVEQILENLCQEYERQKQDLIDRWDS